MLSFDGRTGKQKQNTNLFFLNRNFIWSRIFANVVNIFKHRRDELFKKQHFISDGACVSDFLSSYLLTIMNIYLLYKYLYSQLLPCNQI